MLSLITGLFTGGSGSLIAMVLGALLVAGGTAYVTHRVDEGTIASLQAQYDAKAAADDAKALAVQKQFETAANKAIAEAQTASDSRQQQIAALQKQIANEPKTSACSTSPAVRDMLNSLRTKPQHS